MFALAVILATRSVLRRANWCLFAVVVVPILFVMTSGCDSGPRTTAPDDTKTNSQAVSNGTSSRVPTVVATTSMIADVTREIAGDSATVIALMGPGVDPHLYQPTARDLQRLKSGDLVLYNGLHLEGRMSATLESLGKSRRVIAVATAISRDELIRWEKTDGYDPHIWLDVSLWRKVSALIAEQLVAISPQHETAIRKRAAEYIQQLDDLHNECKSRLAEIPDAQRVLITSHDAFHYFGRAYSLKVIGLQGISTESEAGLRAITDTADLIRARKIAGVFPESSVSRTAIDRLVADSGAVAASELYSDALGSADTSAGTYIGMMRANVSTIVTALKPSIDKQPAQPPVGKEG